MEGAVLHFLRREMIRLRIWQPRNAADERVLVFDECGEESQVMKGLLFPFCEAVSALIAM